MNASTTIRPVQKLSKRELAKVKPGTWLLIAWSDADPTPALLLERIDGRSKGEADITAYYPGTPYSGSSVHSRAVHTQVLAVLDDLIVPSTPACYESVRRT